MFKEPATGTADQMSATGVQLVRMLTQQNNFKAAELNQEDFPWILLVTDIIFEYTHVSVAVLALLYSANPVIGNNSPIC